MIIITITFNMYHLTSFPQVSNEKFQLGLIIHEKERHNFPNVLKSQTPLPFKMHLIIIIIKNKDINITSIKKKVCNVQLNNIYRLDFLDTLFTVSKEHLGNIKSDIPSC